MKKINLLLLLSLVSVFIYSQRIEMSDSELKIKLDSVLTEAHLLYRYEKAAWISTDLAKENKAVNKNFGGYLTYEDDDKIKVIIIGKNQKECIAEYSFTDNFKKPHSIVTKKRKFTNKEETLIEVRSKILENISDKKYDILIPKGYMPNLILIPFNEKYKLYIIMGTSQREVIPFGNDFIFITDKNGKVEYWHKFHSWIIPGYTKYEGYKVSELTHSHLKTTPLITATDICTFMLYAPLYDINIFSVYSPALGIYMRYNLKENKITIEKPNSEEDN